MLWNMPTMRDSFIVISSLQTFYLSNVVVALPIPTWLILAWCVLHARLSSSRRASLFLWSKFPVPLIIWRLSKRMVLLRSRATCMPWGYCSTKCSLVNFPMMILTKFALSRCTYLILFHLLVIMMHPSLLILLLLSRRLWLNVSKIVLGAWRSCARLFWLPCRDRQLRWMSIYRQMKFTLSLNARFLLHYCPWTFPLRYLPRWSRAGAILLLTSFPCETNNAIPILYEAT